MRLKFQVQLQLFFGFPNIRLAPGLLGGGEGNRSAGEEKRGRTCDSRSGDDG